MVKALLVAHKHDYTLKDHFEGTAKDGILKGYYSGMPLWRTLIGYVGIHGNYDLEKGDLKIEVAPNLFFWGMQCLCGIGVLVLGYKGIFEHPFFLGAGFCLFFSMIIFIMNKHEKQEYIYQLKRVYDERKKEQQ